MITATVPEQRQGAESLGPGNAISKLEGVDYRRREQSEKGQTATLRIVSGPLSLGTLIFWGVVIFVAGFLHGRQMSNLAAHALERKRGSSAPAAELPMSSSAPSPTPSAQTTSARVTIWMLKFSPDKILRALAGVIGLL